MTQRWGIRDASTKNHNVIQICLDEVRRCFETSPINLPVLVHLAFDRYGWVPVPSEIEHELFLKLIEETAESERTLLHTAYVHDRNRSPEVHRLRSTDQLRNWSELEPKLRTLLEKSVLIKHKLKSLTEQEVRFALDLDPKRVILLTKSTSSGKKESDNFEAQELFRNSVKESIPSSHHIELSQTDSDECDYKKSFANSILRVIEPKLAELKKSRAEQTVFQDELVHQMQFAIDRERNFIGRSDLLKTVLWDINKRTKNVFVFTGASGSGKSTFIAKVCVELKKAGHYPLLRFCGTSNIASQRDNIQKYLIKHLEGILGFSLLR